MKMLFDPKWLPELKEVDIPAHLVVLGDVATEDIRRLHREIRQMEPPMAIFHIDPVAFTFRDPMIAFDPANNGTAVAIVNGTQSLKFVPLLSSLDLSEYAAPDTKSAINKALRKKRDAQKASQNAKGRKWWEHR